MANGSNFYYGNRKKLRQTLNSKNEFAELIVVTGHSFMQASADRAFPFEQDSSFFYFTGINEPETVLVIDGAAEYLIVPERSDAQITFEGALDTEHMANLSGVEMIHTATEGWQRLSKRLQELKSVATLEPPEKYIAHYEMFTNPSRQRLVKRMHEQVKDLKIYDIRTHVAELRMIKTGYEINMIQRAIDETKKVFEAIEQKREEAEYEHDLLAEITYLTAKQQLRSAFNPIIASGGNASTLHYVKNNARIDKKGMLLLDIGMKCSGYSADISRTVSYEPTERQLAVYDAVLDVQNYALNLLKPGTVIKAYEESVRQYMGEQLQKLGLTQTISKEAIREYYPHSASHFLGLDTHDTADYKRPLAPGMVLTVEPGIYIRDEGIGIRLEDDIVITDDGNKVLTGALPKNISSLTIST